MKVNAIRVQFNDSDFSDIFHVLGLTIHKYHSELNRDTIIKYLYDIPQLEPRLYRRYASYGEYSTIIKYLANSIRISEVSFDNDRDNKYEGMKVLYLFPSLDKYWIQ